MGSSSSSSLDGYPEETFLGTAVSFEVEKGQDPVPGNNNSSSSSSSRCRNSRRAQSSGAKTRNKAAIVNRTRPGGRPPAPGGRPPRRAAA